MTTRKSYRLLVEVNYPSTKDGERRIVGAGVVVDDLPPTDVKWMLKQGAIEPADDEVPAPEQVAEQGEGR